VSTADNDGVSVGATTTQVLAVNTARTFAALVNDSDEIIYLSLSGTAIANKRIRLNVGGMRILRRLHRCISWSYLSHSYIEDALDAASTDVDECTLILIAPHATYNINRTGDPTWSANVILQGT